MLTFLSLLSSIEIHLEWGGWYVEYGRGAFSRNSGAHMAIFKLRADVATIHLSLCEYMYGDSNLLLE